MANNLVECDTLAASDLNQPTVQKLQEWLDPLEDWQVFAVHLPGIPDANTTRQKIERDRPNNIRLQKLDLFSEWIRVDPAPSWEKVIVALRTAKEYDLALKIEKLTGTTVQISKGKLLHKV